MIGKMVLYTGLAMVGAAALKAMSDLLRSDPFDPWAAVLAAGCILASIGLGLTKADPWTWIVERAGRAGRAASEK